MKKVEKIFEQLNFDEDSESVLFLKEQYLEQIQGGFWGGNGSCTNNSCSTGSNGTCVNNACSGEMRNTLCDNY